MSLVVIHTDGSCWPNPGGPGGWAAVIESSTGERVELSGRHPGPTTNNRMEIQGAIEGLKALRERSTVQIITDSKYLRNAGATWIKLWKKRGWVTRERTPVKNEDLWRELDALMEKHTVKWTWMRGHQRKNNENDRCDTLANNQRGSRSF